MMSQFDPIAALKYYDTQMRPSALSPKPLSPADKLAREKWEHMKAQPKARSTIQGADDYQYYRDTGERVLPGIEKGVSPADQLARDRFEYQQQQDAKPTVPSFADKLAREKFSYQQQQDAAKPGPQRRIIKGGDGFNYYTDTGERVLPGTESQVSPADQLARDRFEYQQQQDAKPTVPSFAERLAREKFAYQQQQDLATTAKEDEQHQFQYGRGAKDARSRELAVKERGTPEWQNYLKAKDDNPELDFMDYQTQVRRAGRPLTEIAAPPVAGWETTTTTDPKTGTKTSSMKVIPDGPVDRANKAKELKYIDGYKRGKAQYRITKSTVKRVRDMVVKYGAAVVGPGSLLNAIPGTPAADLAGMLETLSGSAMITAMNGMRQGSAVGATGLGAMSEKEGSALTAQSADRWYRLLVPNNSCTC